jgi:predicted amidohydrolase YtcJ
VLDALSAFVNDVNLKGSHDPTYDDWRPILTHCQILGADLVEKMKALNAIANIQPSFVPTGKARVR